MAIIIKPATSFRALFTLPRLKTTWRLLRKELSKVSVRDCIDYLESDLGSYQWLRKVQQELLEGTYQPKHPGRREEAKSNGAFRIITVPFLDDVLVFRHLADYIYRRAKPHEPPQAYFSRRFPLLPIGRKIDRLSDDDYLTFFHVWLRYSNYRKHLGLSHLYNYIVVTDITNYFDSIQHSLLLEYLAPYGVPRQALGVLGKLLDVLRPSAGHSSSPAVGLPVDFYECSKTLAHIFLFEHDRRITSEVGRTSYVRWMDDQNVGVKSTIGARKLIRKMVQSLGTQKLTLNTGKTKILTPEEVSEHFWLDLNEELDQLEEKVKKTRARHHYQADFEAIWNSFTTQAKQGHWDKLVKRMYRLAGLLKSDKITLVHHKEFLVDAPQLAERIFEYILSQNRFWDYLRLFKWLLNSGNSLYENVEAQWFESLLLSSPPPMIRSKLRKIAVEFVRGSKRGTGKLGPRVPAALLIYWLWDGRQGKVLETILNSLQVIDGPTRRTMAAILCARKGAQAERWLLLAAREPSPEVSSIIQLINKLREGKPVVLPKPLIFVKYPPVFDRYIYDARAWLRLELLTLSFRKDVRGAVKNALKFARKNPLQSTENIIATRIEKKLGIK